MRTTDFSIHVHEEVLSLVNSVKRASPEVYEQLEQVVTDADPEDTKKVLEDMLQQCLIHGELADEQSYRLELINTYQDMVSKINFLHHFFEPTIRRLQKENAE